MTLSTVIWVFFSQLSIRDSVRSTLAAAVLLQLKFSRPFTNVISFKAFYGIQPWVFHFLSNGNIQAESHFAIFQVVLFLRSTCCFQFLCTEYGTVWGITKAKFRRRTSHEPNRMQMRKILCSPSLAFDSAHVKYGVWTGPCVVQFTFCSHHHNAHKPE